MDEMDKQFEREYRQWRIGLVCIAFAFAAVMLWPAMKLTYYDARLLMKKDEIERCLHIAGGYRAFGHNVVCVDIRR
jgi:hypothetical protein